MRLTAVPPFLAALVLCLVGVLATPGRCLAANEAHEGRAPVPDVAIPARLTLDGALSLARAHGLDLLIADAATLSAQADTQTAGAVRNPNVSFSDGPTFNYSTKPPCSGCQRDNLSWAVGDNGALVDVLSGKRGLRKDVARSALAAARLTRVDAERTLLFLVKQQYVRAASAQRTLQFSVQLRDNLQQAVDLATKRYPGVIDESDLARVEVQKLEADQALAGAVDTVRQARLGLAVLLGVRHVVADFEIDDTMIDFRVPAGIASLDEDALLQRAFARRPDLKVQDLQRIQAQTALRLARRQQLPDVNLSVNFNALGYGQDGASPPYLAPGVQTSLPIFYQQQGEIRRAQANLAIQSLQHAKAAAQIVSDVDGAIAAVKANRELVERMEKTLLERATLARGAVERQYLAGSTSLTDYLDAQRIYLSTNLEHIADLAAYWTAVFQLETAVGEELSR